MKLTIAKVVLLLFLNISSKTNSEVVKDSFTYKANDSTEQLLKEIDAIEKVAKCTSDVMVSFFDREKKGDFCFF